MAREDAKVPLSRAPGERLGRPWLSVSDLSTMVDVIYDDMSTSVQEVQLRVPPLHGASLAPWRAALPDTVAQVEALGSNLVTLSVKAEGTLTGSTVTVDPSEWVWADAAYEALSTDRLILLEPYPFLDGGAGLETEWNPTDVDAWFVAWQAAILTLADRYPDAWGIYIASNLVYLESHHDKWASLITAVRQAHPTMKIVMRTNWWYTARELPSSFDLYESKLVNPVFDAIDVLAIAWYFELTETAGPDLDELIDVMSRGTSIPYGTYPREQNIVEQVAALSAAHGDVPIFAGELVVSRHAHGARAPWSNTIGTGASPMYPSDPRDRQLQRRYFQAWMEVIGAQPWCLGYSIYGVGYAYPGDNEYTLDSNAVTYLASQAARADYRDVL